MHTYNVKKSIHNSDVGGNITFKKKMKMREEKNYIRKICYEKNVSEHFLASKLGVSINKLRRRENHVGDFKVKECEIMSRLLGVSIDKLILETKYPSIDVSMLSIQQLNQITSFILDFTSQDWEERAKTRRLNNTLIDHLSLQNRLRFIRVNIFGLSLQKLALKFEFDDASITSSWETRGLVFMNQIIEISKVSQISLDYIVKQDYPLSISSYGMSRVQYEAVKSMVEYYKNGER